MSQVNDQMIAFNKAMLEAANRFSGIALKGAEEMLKLQMEAAKDAISKGMQQAQALAGVKDAQDLAQLKETMARPDLEKAAGYLKNVFDVAATTQAEINKLVEEQVAEFNRQVEATVDQSSASAVPGTEPAVAVLKSAYSAINTAYDNLLKMNRQFAEMSKATIENATAQAAKAGRKK